MQILKQVLNEEDKATIRDGLSKAGFAEGAKTAGAQALKVKHNLQLAADSAEQQRLSGIVTRALNRHPGFFSSALPAKLTPILFNRYEIGMDYGIHVDNAYMGGRGKPGMRSDIAATLFLSDPATYDGGELTVHNGQMVQKIKLPAGDMVVYPANSRHRVEPVTRGKRDAAVFWVQSMVRQAERRQMLYELDRAIQGLVARAGSAGNTGAYDRVQRVVARMDGGLTPHPQLAVGYWIEIPAAWISCW
jgi:PKHD-type hydroxylase